MKYARNALMVHLRFMDMSISMLQPVQYTGTIASDGTVMCYDPLYILKLYKREKELLPRTVLHTIMHCVFRHNIVSTLVDKQLWDLACDMTVENIINDLDLPFITSSQSSAQKNVIDLIRPKAKYITAEKLYAYLMDSAVPSDIEIWSQLFSADDHSNWYEPKMLEYEISKEKKKQKSKGSGSPDDDQGDEGDRDPSEDERSESYIQARAKLEQEWKDISERMQSVLENFSKHHGDSAGDLMQNINAVNREKYDYTSFLKRFAVMGEAMKINDDEFDYIFYTYGLTMYDNMPLIEPLEYKEVKRIKEFVIAIDTSGSVQGELVQKFIQKTYNILMQEESFFTKINVHIIQCDAEIQQDTKITSKEEMESYIKNMKLFGFGGTDFRPVFDYVDTLRKNKEFTDLRGLIYFTDGYGDFPSHQPDYHTAFVFIEDDYGNPDVPVWAIKLVLQSDEI
ncbi:MAG: metallopeptidase [Oribacterium sp.]|nr:metallopeptidase [Oribacterium sp.]